MLLLTGTAQLGQSRIAQSLARHGKRGEGILRLANHDDVAYHAKKVGAPQGIHGVTCLAEYGSENILEAASSLRTDRRGIRFEHLLMFFEPREVLLTEPTILRIIGLLGMIAKADHQRVVLRDRIVELRAKEIGSLFHACAPS